MSQSPLDYSASPAAPRAAPRRNRAIAAAAILFALVASVVFLNFRDEEYNLSPSRLEQVGGFMLPPGATKIKSHLNTAHGYILAVKFDMPATQTNAFIQSTNCGEPDGTSRSANDLFFQTLGDPWWKPGQPSKYYGERWRNSDALGGFLIDETNPNVYTVWMIVSYD